MIKRLLVIICLINPGFSVISSQNLVLNPSFEAFSACPMGPSEFDITTNWQNPFINLVTDTCSTSDLYNSCNPFGGFGVDVPNNILGSEAARTGNGYAGIIAYEGIALFGCTVLGGSNWREYAEGTLSAPLVAGQDYCVTFYVSLADQVKFATDDLGVYFSNAPVAINCTSVSNSVLPLTPQLQWAGGSITNTSGWTQLQWTYTASGGESYLTIGNFKDDANTTRTCANSGAFNPYAYYYLEDVSVIAGACGVLPVQISSFEGSSAGNSVVLDWITLQEEDNSSFEIERSGNGNEWIKIGEISGGGTSKEARNYTFTDANPEEGLNMYRLLQRDFNGTSRYSEVITVAHQPSFYIGELYPNPSGGIMTTSVFMEKASPVTYRVFDLAGRILHDEQGFLANGNHDVKLDLRSLDPGFYYLVIRTNNYEVRRPFSISGN